MEMTAKQIKQYSARSIPWLRKKAGEVFRAWIRRRDAGQRCISCGGYNPTDAGHYYSAGHYPELEFDPDNVHLQCKQCNLFKHGNGPEYRARLTVKIGEERIKRLDFIVAASRQTGYKHDRFRLIEIINQYK